MRFFSLRKTFHAQKQGFTSPKSSLFRETFNFWKLSYILPIFFAGKCFSWSKTPTYFFSCAGKFLNHTFSQKNKLSPLPKARDFRRFFHWIFCTTPMFDVELSTVGKLFLHAFQRYQARYRKCPWCNCPNVFLLRKSRKIAKNRAILRKSFRHISTPQQLLSSSLSPLESSFHALSNGAKLDILSARGVELWTFFFFENHEKSLKIAQSCFSTFASTTPVKNTQKSNKMSNCLAGY